MTIIIAKMREKSVEQTLLANKIATEDEHLRVQMPTAAPTQTQPARRSRKFHSTEFNNHVEFAFFSGCKG